MSKYIAKRIIYFIPVLFGIVFLVYSIMYLAPGDPARMILGDKVCLLYTSPERRGRDSLGITKG